jgi:uncharacterized protein YjbI with pentapeptide repeats
MDLDVTDKHFFNCEINDGDFAGTTFRNCEFEKTAFILSFLIGVTFIGCIFLDCRFISAVQSFSMKNCNIKDFTVIKK